MKAHIAKYNGKWNKIKKFDLKNVQKQIIKSLGISNEVLFFPEHVN